MKKSNGLAINQKRPDREMVNSLRAQAPVVRGFYKAIEKVHHLQKPVERRSHLEVKGKKAL